MSRRASATIASNTRSEHVTAIEMSWDRVRAIRQQRGSGAHSTPTSSATVRAKRGRGSSRTQRGRETEDADADADVEVGDDGTADGTADGADASSHRSQSRRGRGARRGSGPGGSGSSGGGGGGGRTVRSLAARETDRRYLELLHQAECQNRALDQTLSVAVTTSSLDAPPVALTTTTTTATTATTATTTTTTLDPTAVAVVAEASLTELALRQAMLRDMKRQRKRRRRGSADDAEGDDGDDGDDDADGDAEGAEGADDDDDAVDDGADGVHGARSADERVASRDTTTSSSSSSSSSRTDADSDEEQQVGSADAVLVEGLISKERKRVIELVQRRRAYLRRAVRDKAIEQMLAGTLVHRRALARALALMRAELAALERENEPMRAFEDRARRFRREYGVAHSVARTRGHGLAREARPHTVLGAPKTSSSTAGMANLNAVPIRSGVLTGSSFDIRRDLTDRFLTETAQWRQTLAGADVTEAPKPPVYVMHAEICEDCAAPMRIIANDALLGCPRCHKVRVFEQPSNSVSASIAHGDSSSGSGMTTGTGTAAARSQSSSNNAVRYLTLSDLTAVVGTPTGAAAVCMHEARLRRFLLSVNEALRDLQRPERHDQMIELARARLPSLSILVRRMRDYALKTSDASHAGLGGSGSGSGGGSSAVSEEPVAPTAPRFWIPMEAIAEALKASSSSSSSSSSASVSASVSSVAGGPAPPSLELLACFAALNGFVPPQLTMAQQERIVVLFRAVAASMLPRVTGNVPPAIHPWFARVACTLLGWREASGSFMLPPASTHTRLMMALEEPARELEWDFDGLVKAVTIVREGTLALPSAATSVSALRGNVRFQYRTAVTPTFHSGGFVAKTFSPATQNLFVSMARRPTAAAVTATAAKTSASTASSNTGSEEESCL